MAAPGHQCGSSAVVTQKDMDLRRDLELIEKIQDKEERLRGLLAPLESHIIWFQKVLVWEHPYLSVALLLIVNILFWLATTWRIYCLFGIVGMIAVAVEMWISCIFTETAREDGQDSDISEGWTEVCPRLMGVPEVSNYLAHGWVHGLQWLDKAISFRTENKPKFFVCSIFFLSIFAIIGVYIPGIYMSYFTVMSLLLWPALSYHNIVGRIHAYVDPFIERIEQKLHIKRRRTKKGGKRKKGKRKPEAGEDDSDSDLNIDEFIPPVDSLILTTLTKAVDDPLVGDEDDDSASYTPSEFTPHHPSQGESHEHTDDELLSEDLSMLVHDVKEMPSIDDLDNAHAEIQHLLPNTNEDVDRLLNISDDEEDIDNGQQFIDPKMPQSLEESDKMTFVSSHFKEESDDEEDEDKLTEGLSFSNLRDDGLDVEEKLENESKVLGVIGGLISQSHSSLVAALKSPVISQTMSSVMTGTLSGISAIRNTVASMSNQGAGSSAGQAPSPDGDAASATGGAGNPSSDLQVLESEFEFLEQEELDLANATSNN